MGRDRIAPSQTSTRAWRVGTPVPYKPRSLLVYTKSMTSSSRLFERLQKEYPGLVQKVARQTVEAVLDLASEMARQEPQESVEEGLGFKTGDVVGLKAGGPSMTVIEVHPSKQEVTCVWINTAGDQQLTTLPAAVFVRINQV